MRKRYQKIAVYLLSIIAVVSFLFVFNKYYANADPVTNPSVGEESVDSSIDTGRWKEDAEVTAVGKAAARAREVLNWALSIENAGFSSSGGSTGKDSTILTAWGRVRDLMGIIYLGILIVIGFGLIAKATWAEKTRRILPALIISFIAAYFSYFILTKVIQFTDGQIQNRIYTIHKWGESGTLAEKHLKAQDLLTVSFSYQEFKGYRKVGSEYGEAIANHLMLVKATTLTNYIISFIILLRIVILWGLVIFSPFIFPFFIFELTKNVASVWIREFFRWLILGPLFALFISFIPYIWNNTNIPVANTYQNQKAKNSGIPITVNKDILTDSGSSSMTSQNVYESGTNIILAPPGNENAELQKDSNIASGNNLSETDTYSRWIVALLMIWGAIILPFILLRVVMTFSVEAGKGISGVLQGSLAGQYLSTAKKASGPSGTPANSQATNASLRLVSDKIVSKIPQINNQKRVTFRTTTSDNAIRQQSAGNGDFSDILSASGINQQSPSVFNLSSNVANATTKQVSELARIEQSPETLNRESETIASIANPASSANPTVKNRFDQVRRGVIAGSIAGDKSAEAFKNAMTGNISKYLNSDVNNEMIEEKFQRINNDIAQISAPIMPDQQEKIKSTMQISRAENFSEVLSQLKEKQDPRASGAESVFKTILETKNMPVPQKNNAIMEISKNLTETERISDPTVKQGYESIKSIMVQVSEASGNHLDTLINDAHDYYNISADDLANKQIIDKLSSDFAGSLGNFLSSDTLKNKIAMSGNALLNEQISKTTQALQKTTEQSGNIQNQEILKTAKKLSNPQAIADGAEKQEFQSIQDIISDEAKNGNEQALAIEETMNNIANNLEIDESGKSTVTNIAKLRRLVEQDQDFQNTKRIWQQNYKNATNPPSEQKSLWIRNEIKNLEENLNNILSSDNIKKKKALDNISKLVPFALLGNYKISDIAKYLLAKYDAARLVLAENQVNKIQ